MIPLEKKYNKNLDTCFFLHANGFPPDAYRTLLSLIENKYASKSMLLRPLWEENGEIKKINNWDIFLNDFLHYYNENRSQGNIGIGHSIGGNILIRSAIKNKNLFKSIVLLDPTIFRPSVVVIWKILNSLNMFKWIHPYASAARNRRENYDTYKEILESYKKKDVFLKINDLQLEEYINSIFKYKNGNYKLIYNKQWEEIIYLKAALKDFDIWNNLDSLTVPTLIIKPDKNAVLGVKASKKLLKNKFITIKTINESTHLFPLEYPKETSSLIFDFFLKHNI